MKFLTLTTAVILLVGTSSLSQPPTPTPPKTETQLSVVVVPPDGRYEVTVTPQSPASANQVAWWFVFPRKDVQTISRNASHWKMRVKPGNYEVTYSTQAGGVQVDSFTEFKVGDVKPDDPVDPDDPIDPPPPPPDTTKLPFPATGFYAVFVSQDTAMNKYTPVQRAALGGQAVADYLNAKATKDGGGKPAWRSFDLDQQFTGEGMWKDAWKRAVADAAKWAQQNPGQQPPPWLVCGNGTKGFSGPVDGASLDKTLDTLKQFGGP